MYCKKKILNYLLFIRVERFLKKTLGHKLSEDRNVKISLVRPAPGGNVVFNMLKS